MIRLSKELESFMLPWCGVRVNDKGEVVEKPEEKLYYKVKDSTQSWGDYLSREFNKATLCIKLPTMIEFVKKIGKKVVADNSHCFMLTNQYADFLSQQNDLGMYVASKDGEVLEEPRIEDYIFEHHPELVGNPKEYDYDSFELDSSDYRIHQSEVMFFGWEYSFTDSLEYVVGITQGENLLHWVHDEMLNGDESLPTLEQAINNTQLFYVVGK
ncbi:MAG: hypothetical protein ACI9JN_001286 [Bacteroidia bacterium]|jgi:hypothetical protein